MATYGNYETVGRLYSIGARSVYSAREVGVEGDLRCQDPRRTTCSRGPAGWSPRSPVGPRSSVTDPGPRRAWAEVFEVGTTGVLRLRPRAALPAARRREGPHRGRRHCRVVWRIIGGCGCATSSTPTEPQAPNVLIDRTGRCRLNLSSRSSAPNRRTPPPPSTPTSATWARSSTSLSCTSPSAVGGYPSGLTRLGAAFGDSYEQWRALCFHMLIRRPAGLAQR